jgi:hypothetical protein
MKTTFKPAIKSTLRLLTALLFTPLAALHAADSSRDLLGERGLPRILFNNDSDAAKFTRSGSMLGPQIPVEQHMGGSKTWMVFMEEGDRIFGSRQECHGVLAPVTKINQEGWSSQARMQCQSCAALDAVSTLSEIGGQVPVCFACW